MNQIKLKRICSSLLWIVLQFFIITVAEVMISITGLEFAYTQSPPSMKSVLTSFWLLCTSVGNMIVIFVAEAKFMPTQLGEYLLFAAIVFAADIVFVLLAMFKYEYVKDNEFEGFTYPKEISGVDIKDEEDAEMVEGVGNEGFEGETVKSK